MNEQQLGGTNQPGTPRLGRGDQRLVQEDLETDLGIDEDVAIEGEVVCGDVMAERYSSLPRVRELNDCQCLCVWPRDRISVNRMWHLVREKLSPHGDRVCKIAQVNQPRDVLRYDIYVKAVHLTWTFRRLRRQAQSVNWFIKRHQSFWVRRLQRVREPLTLDREPQSHNRVKVSTWNIHSSSQKREEIAMYAQKNDIGVLALQETWRKANQWPLRLKGFNVFESVAEQEVPGRKGVAVCVRSSLVAYEIGEVSPYTVIVRILIGTVEWNVMSVYVPPNSGSNGLRGSRKEALAQIKRGIRRLVNQDLGVKIAIMGDWNMKSDGLKKLIRKWRLPLAITPCQGSPFTFVGRNTWSAIDHMVMTHEAAMLSSKCRVNRTWDLSDHWPLENVIRGVLAEGDVAENTDGIIQQPLGLRVDVTKLRSTQYPIVDDNRWRVLAIDDDDENADQIAVLFEHTVRDICEEAKVVKPPPSSPRGPSYRLSKKAKLAIWKRRVAYKLWVQHAAPVNEGLQWDRYLEYKALALKEKRKASQESWLRHVANGANALALQDMHGFWRWVKTTIHRGKSGPSDLGPLKCPDTRLLVYQPREKLLAWKTHYERLLADVSGHSRDALFWAEKFQGPPLQPIPGLDGDIRWQELNAALHKLKSHKAPGKDGIPSDFYKLAAEEVNRPEEGIQHPQTEMGKALLKIVNTLFRSGIPSRWNEAWVVSILKSGDPTDMNNYRGISLIVVIVKLTTLVITMRLTTALEGSDFFIKEQAGFRWREECAGHVCALYEILRRRQIQEKRTFVAFIDIRKAYDTVPIEGVLRKLYMIGVSGRALEYFRSLYTGAVVRVRTKYGLSDVVRLLRGLRQGCNASPLLFDIFINDILSECKTLGVKVLGVNNQGRIAGLLYADDLVLICSSRRALHIALEKIQAWGTLHEMAFGVNKCGVMGFGEGAMDDLRLHEWSLDGQIIPTVERYDYLGIPFTSDLDVSLIPESRAEKGLKALNAIRPLVSCLQIPILVRINVLKAIVVPVLVYGGELWGMQSNRSEKPQRVLNEALRLLIRQRAKSSLTSSATLGLEFGIPPISAMVAAARVRALKKFPQLRTVIADLIGSPIRSRQHTWVSGSVWWLKRFCREASGVLNPHIAAKMVKTSVWNRYNATAKSKSLKFFLDNRLERTSKYLAIATHNPTIARGIFWLCRLRLGAVWYANRLAAIGYINADYRNKCPFCNEAVVETPEHLLMICSRWRQYREECLGAFIATHNPTWIQLLGGSNLEGDMEGEDNMANIARVWCPETPGHIALHPLVPQVRDDNNDMMLPTCALVAQYLQQVMPIRFGLLHNLIEVPRADADHGMAVLIDPPEFLDAEAGSHAEDNAEVDDDDDGNIDARGGLVAADH